MPLDPIYIAVIVSIVVVVVSFVGTRPEVDQAEAETAIKDRYAANGETDKSGMIEAVNYLEAVIDRQISKASGILAFDALMLTLISVLIAYPGKPKPEASVISFLYLDMMTFLLSGGLCLWMFRVHVPAKDTLATFEKEVGSSVAHIWARATLIERAVRLSLFGTLGVALWTVSQLARP